MGEKHAAGGRKRAERNRKGKIPVPAEHKDEFQHLPSYRPTVLPPLPPKHPPHFPAPNRRGR